MPRKANKSQSSEKTAEDQLAELQRKLEVEEKARIEAERRAEQLESENDLSIKKSVMNEALAVAESNRGRQPQVSEMVGGTKRIDF